MSDASAELALPTWQEVLDFWFDKAHAPLWFKVDTDFDSRIRARFTPLIEAAVAGELAAWEEAPRSCLALLIVLDQMTRNAWRGTPRAFCGDARGLEVADRALARGFDGHVPLSWRRFFYLTFEHSENLAHQQRCCVLFQRLVDDAPEKDRAWAAEQMRYVERHREIIERFGRFPHRNAILSRPSTPEEEAFLKEPMSSF
jgi:uncharacterized protein (DUF924 family)